jgi:membrane protein
MNFQSLGKILKKTGKEWLKHNPLLLGASISFYVILSLGPVLAVIILVLGEILGNQAAQGKIVEEIENIVGEKPASALQTIIEKASSSSFKTMAIISSIPLLFFGTTMVFFQLRNALNLIWEVEEEEKDFKEKIKNYSFSFLMLIIVGFFFLLLVLKDPALSFIEGNIIGIPGPLFQILNLILSFILISLLFAAVYKILLNVKIGKDIWIGAVVTSFLFLIVQFLVGINAKNSEVDSAFGALGYITILLLWVFYSSLIFLFGAVFTKIYSTQYGELS